MSCSEEQIELLLRNTTPTELHEADDRGDCPCCGFEMVNSSFTFSQSGSDFVCIQCYAEFKIIEVNDESRLIQIKGNL